jgi:hypothetical protein
MSYTEYLRNKLSAQQKVTAVRKPTDASVCTQKTRMAATGHGFFVDGTGVGSLFGATDRPANNHRAISYPKATGKGAAASDFTTYVGSAASGEDIRVQKLGGVKYLPCAEVFSSPWMYPSASDTMRARKCADIDTKIFDAPSDPKFVDDTIRLSAGVPDMVTSGCCDNKGITEANHTRSPGIQRSKQIRAYGKPFFMANPPNPQGPNVSSLKPGGYLGPRVRNINKVRGSIEPTQPIPTAPGGQGQTIAQLKINRPTLFNIK